jgi:glycosyltransferase involved in cell wall biosynthesis
MPVFNMQSSVKESVMSILNQTYQNFELLIVDDGSTDGTWNVLEEIKNNKIKLFRFENNKGRPFARNFLLDKAQGQYIAWLDADDFAVPNLLEIKLNVFNVNPQLVGLGNNAIFRFNQTFYIKKRVINPNLLMAQLLFKSPFVFCSFMHRKVKDLFFDLSLNRSEDINFIYDLHNYGKVLNIPDNLVIVNYTSVENHHKINTSSLPYIKLYIKKVLPINDQFPLDIFIILFREPKKLSKEEINQSILAYKKLLPDLKIKYPKIFNEIKVIYAYQVLKCSWVISPVFLRYLLYANPFHVYQLYKSKY